MGGEWGRAEPPMAESQLVGLQNMRVLLEETRLFAHNLAYHRRSKIEGARPSPLRGRAADRRAAGQPRLVFGTGKGLDPTGFQPARFSTRRRLVALPPTAAAPWL